MKNLLFLYSWYIISTTQENPPKKVFKSDINTPKIHHLHLDMIKNKVIDKNILNLPLTQYTEIIHQPKKDVCDVWEKLKISSPEEA